MEKLLYELEYDLQEKRHNALHEIKYNNLSVKELLDLGLNDTFILIDNVWYELGYKSVDGGYYSDGYGYLNDDQLKVMVKYVDDEISDCDHLEISVALVNDDDKKYF